MGIESISHILIDADQYGDYCPGFSTVTNFVDIFQKCICDLTNSSCVNSNPYYTHLKDKSYVRCLILLIPFLGNIAIAFYDYFMKQPMTTATDKPILASAPKGPINPQPYYQPASKNDEYPFRAKIYAETKEACERGYVNRNGVVVQMDHGPMLKGSVTFDRLATLPPPAQVYKTNFSVQTVDTFQALLKQKAAGANPVGINMANLRHAGGGVARGMPAQEEESCRTSTLMIGLTTQKYPLPMLGGSYCPHVLVFRNGISQGYTFLDQPQEVAMVSVAAFDLRPVADPNILSDQRLLGLNLSYSDLRPPYSAETLKKLRECEAYIEGSKNKFRNMLRIMALNNHTHLVLGAIGCGAFLNPPEIIAGIFEEILSEPEFKGRFIQVDFAILKIFEHDQRNVDAFTGICNRLNSQDPRPKVVPATANSAGKGCHYRAWDF